VSRIVKLNSDDIGRWLSLLSQEGNRVFAPYESKNGKLWKLYDPEQQMDTSDGVPVRSIKEFFFPQPEVLLEFSYRRSDSEALIMKEPAPANTHTVIIGARPCDARSVMLNSMPYAEDPYFNKHLEDTTIIGFSCKEQGPTCFCTWTGGSPMGTEGMDIMLVSTPDEDTFLAEAVTEKGERLLGRLNGCPEASDTERQWLADEHTKWKDKAIQTGSPSDTLKACDLMQLYNAPFWQEIADACINCGACTFLCPTCYCFDIQDEKAGNGQGQRIRYWDSCMFPLFTKHASGHNPRGQKIQRCRNRFMHKLRYFPERFGELSCVGCGRCIRSCPVNIDIREVLRDMLTLAQS
jgi:ferredoxin